jgi:hypothetical protein
MKITPNQIQNYLKEGDILLFKSPSFPKLGWWVAKYTLSDYSHIGLVHFIDKEAYCLEFKEFVGCRVYKLSDYILQECDRIDVFRTARHVCFTNSVHNFTEETAKNITYEAHKFIGKKYNWSLIFYISLWYIPIVRLFLNSLSMDRDNASSFICSSFIAFLWRKHFVDLVSNLDDDHTKPGDIARSPLLEKLYTLSCGEENE